MQRSPTPVLQLDASVSPLSTPAPAGLIRYQGRSGYGRGYPDFVLWYDPSAWRFVPGGDGQEDRLVAQGDEQCIFTLRASGGYGAIALAAVQLAGREWTIFNSNDPQAVSYSMPWRTAGYLFIVHLPQPYSAAVWQPCQRLVERVLETFEVLETVQYTVEPWFVVTFSSTVWTLNPTIPGQLASTVIPGCELLLDMEQYRVHTQLAEQQWAGVWAYSPRWGTAHTSHGGYLIFSRSVNGQAIFIRLTLPVEPALAGQCQEQAEAVLETLQVLPVESAVYRGPNPFHRYATGSEFPMFEVYYDPERWAFTDGEPFGPVLVHRNINACSMTLDLPPLTVAEEIGAIPLAGRSWSVYTGPPDSRFEAFLALPYEDIQFSFVLNLAEDFSFEQKGHCQQEIEWVIDTFSIIDSTTEE